MLLLTFNVQVDVGGFAEAEGVFSDATVEAGRVSGDGAEVDLLVRAEDVFEAVLAPGDGGRGITVDDAAQGGVVLLVDQVVQLRLVNAHNGWVCTVGGK